MDQCLFIGKNFIILDIERVIFSLQLKRLPKKILSLNTLFI